MATKVMLNAEPRSERGKEAARVMRREGYVPAVIYGAGEETRACKVETKQLEKLLTTTNYENTLIDLKTAEGEQRVLIREVQFHPFKPEVLHVDFLAVRKGEKIRLDVPVRLLGSSVGVKEGGILEHHKHDVAVRCAPAAIPEALEFDISALDIGETVSVGDLTAPEGVELLDDPSTAICSVVPPTVHVVEEEAELAAAELEEGEEPEPEVVGRGKTEVEEASEGEG